MAGRVSSPDLVGRGTELAELEAALARAADGAAGIVLVAGDSGIGKTRLVGELVARAAASGARTLVGECVELSEGEIPFAPIVSALRRLARDTDPDEFGAILGPARKEITRLFPELAASSEEVVDVLPLGSIAQSRLFELLLGVLERLGQEQPLLLVIEDLHWADRSTRDFLSFLARSVRDEQLLGVVTYRTDELHRRHPLRPFLVQLERMASVERIEVRPLSRGEAEAQLEQILGEQPAPALAQAVYERSEGNPFFIEELLAASTGATALPATLRDTLLLRVEGLSQDAQEILKVVAAAGRRAQHGLLVEVLDLGEDALLHGLREAVGHHILVEASDEASYEFRHALLREAVYDDLLPGERVKLHLALARALERDPALAGQAASLDAELAFHWYAAHELSCALRSSVEAGLSADGMYAFAEAERHYERALELWGSVGDDADRGIGRTELLRRAADAAHHVGNNDRATALIRLLLDELDPECDATTTAAALERLGRYLWVSGHGAEALDVYHRAVAILPDGVSAERARALAAEGQVLMLTDRPLEARARCDEALPMARVVGDRRTEANILNTMIGSMTQAGDFDGSLEAMKQARAIAEELGLPDESLRSYVNGSDALDQAGRVQDALDVALAGVEAARRFGLERLSGHFLQAEASLRLFHLGRWDEARALARTVIRASDQPLPLVIAREADSLISIERGEFDHVRVLLEQSRSIVALQGSSMWIPMVVFPLSLIEVREGRPERARELIDEALEALSSGEYIFFTRGLYATAAWAEADIAERARPMRAEALVKQSEARVVALLERFDRLLEPFGDNHPPPAALASRALVAAELTRVRGASDPEAWARAADAFEALGQPHATAYPRFRQAEALVRAGAGTAVSSEVLASARAVAAEFEMHPLLADIHALVRRARLKLPAAAEAPAAPDHALDERDNLGLTERELEVLALVAEGRTNRQIGAELYMSEKTASVHVSRILAKLGASNRAEAAASAQRLGLVGAP